MKTKSVKFSPNTLYNVEREYRLSVRTQSYTDQGDPMNGSEIVEKESERVGRRMVDGRGEADYGQYEADV